MRAFIDGVEIPLSESFIEYSLEERIVGQWVNGKPLYKRTWYFTTGPTYRTWTAVGIVIADLDEMIEMDVSITTNAGVDVQLPANDTTACGTFTYNRANGNGLEFYFYHPSGNDFKQCPGKATLLYTKTTDQATIEIVRPTASTQSLTESDPIDDVYKELAAGNDTPADVIDDISVEEVNE